MFYIFSVIIVIISILITIWTEDASGISLIKKDKVELSLSGQINRSLLYYNDGDDSYLNNVDNTSSPTRLRTSLIYDKDELFVLGTRVEVALRSRSSARASQIDPRGGSSADVLSERLIEVWAASPRYGTLSIGQGHTASDGSSERDFSLTGVVTYSGVDDFAGGVFFGGPIGLSDLTVGSQFSNFDGLGRDDRFGWRSPTWRGLDVAASIVTEDRWDAALGYIANWRNFDFQTGFALARASPRLSQLSGSASVLHDTGLSLSVAGGYRFHDDRVDAYFTYVKPAYTVRYFKFGRTGFSFDFYHGHQIDAADSRSRSVGIGIVQNIEPYRSQIYLGLRHYDLSHPSFDLDSILAIMFGVRVSF